MSSALHRIVINILFILLAAGVNFHGRGADNKKFLALMEEDWQWQLRQYPEDATRLGHNSLNDRLTDLSLKAIEKRAGYQVEMLRKIKQMERSQLLGPDLISYDLFLRQKEVLVEAQQFPTEVLYYTGILGESGLVAPNQGQHLDFLKILGQMPLGTSKDVQNYLARIKAYALFIDQIILLMKKGMEVEWVPASATIQNVVVQVQNLINGAALETIYGPLRDLPNSIDDNQKIKFASDCQDAVNNAYIPALKRYVQFLRNTYLPACNDDSGCSSLPGGKNYYRFRIRQFTSSRMEPQEIHNLGLKEVARIHQEMEQIRKKVHFIGTFEEFLIYYKTESRYYYDQPVDYLNAIIRVCKRTETELTRLSFALQPDSYFITVMPGFEHPGQTFGYYELAAPDGSRPGYFRVNTNELYNKANYRLEALGLKFICPGYHWLFTQTNLMTQLPAFRRFVLEPVFREGWAGYVQDFGTEMGFYQTPDAQFGRLSEDLWMSCALVVDTGIHALGWSRQKAIEYLLTNTDRSREYVTAEVDRYILWPAQALAAKMGQLKIKALRDQAEKALGANFDLKAFHQTLLENGSLPLDLLEKAIDDWLATQ